jgi:hypothetical protein
MITLMRMHLPAGRRRPLMHDIASMCMNDKHLSKAIVEARRFISRFGNRAAAEALLRARNSLDAGELGTVDYWLDVRDEALAALMAVEQRMGSALNARR